MPQLSQLRRQRSVDSELRGSSPSSRQSRGHSMPPRPSPSPQSNERNNTAEKHGRSSRHDGKVRSQSPKRRLPNDSAPDILESDPRLNQDMRRARAERDPQQAVQNQGQARELPRSPAAQEQHSMAKSKQEGGIPPSSELPGGNHQPQIPAGLNLPPEAFGEDEPVELVMCEGCGRKFKPEALERHAKICKKVFQDKRKQFNSAANRLGEMDNADQLIRNAKKIEKEAAQVKQQELNGGGGKTSPKAEDGKPVPKWKKQSLQFRAAMLAAKADTGDEKATQQAKQVNDELKAMGGSDPANDPTKTQCPHCRRTFNKDSAQRHIDICLKTFGSKAGGGRLVRGGGKNCNPAAKAAPAPTNQSRNNSVASQQARRAPPPMPGSRK